MFGIGRCLLRVSVRSRNCSVLSEIRGGLHTSRKGSMVSTLLPPLPVQACAAHSSSNSSPYLIPTVSATIQCSGDLADGLMEALMSFGASSVSIENGAPTNASDQSGPVAWSNERRTLWKKCEVTALFPPDQDVPGCLALAFDSIGLKEMLQYKLSEVQHQNWEQQIKDLFQPCQVSDKLWIVPHWSSPPDVSATNVILDPGLAFGTGDHPTTRLCLCWLSNVIQGGEMILDYGTGSGILAIAGLKLGASNAVGVDIDPVAVSSAAHNASLNEYDIVVANLLLNPLLSLSKHLLAYIKPNGLLGLSGILESQVDEVQKIYGIHLDNINVTVQDGWACFSGRKSMV